MKGWKKRLLAGLCAVLLTGLLLPALGSASGSTTIYQMAVNERVLDITAENMPMMVNGVLYVPYTMLSSRVTEINLRVTALYSSSKRTLLVSSGQRGVIFDTRANTASDIQGNPLPARAAVRNNMVFLPVDWLCSYFDNLEYSLTWTRYGTLIRITNSDVILDDAEFVDAAEEWLAEKLRRYQDSIAPSAVPSAPATVATPAPTPPPAQPSAPPVQSSAPAVSAPPVQPSAAPVPSPTPSQEPEEGAEFYLALRWGEQGEQAAQLLEGRGLRALFLFTPDELRQQDDAVRRLVGAGHGIGLDLTGAEDCLAMGLEGRRLLAAAARCDTVIACADGPDQDSRTLLREAGYVLWDASLRGERYLSGEALVRGLDPDRLNYVELTCGEGGAAFLRAVLNAADSANCTVYQPTAPALPQQ